MNDDQQTPGPPGAGPGEPKPFTVPDEPLLGYAAVAELLGVNASTVRKYNSDGRMPPPDQVILERPFWRRATIEAWQAGRPGRGRWGATAAPVDAPAAPADATGAQLPPGRRTARTGAARPRLAASAAGRVVHVVDEEQASLPAWSLCGVQVHRWIAQQAARDSRLLRYCDECLQRSEPSIEETNQARTDTWRDRRSHQDD